MPSRTHVLVQFVSILALLAVAAPAGARRTTASDLVHRLNVQRERAGLDPLRTDPRLRASAARQSRRQLRHGYFGHGSSVLASPRFRRLGELLAREPGWHLRTGPIARGWRGSPSHNALVHSAGFQLVGVGWARGWLNGAQITIWTVHLGAR